MIFGSNPERMFMAKWAEWLKHANMIVHVCPYRTGCRVCPGGMYAHPLDDDTMHNSIRASIVYNLRGYYAAQDRGDAR